MSDALRFPSVDSVLDLGEHTFDAKAIKRFAARYDPQPFHLDEAAAEGSLLGGLCASGWHTAAVAMRLTVDAHARLAAQRVASGGSAPRMGPSPGIRDLRFPKPVLAGQTIRFRQAVTSRRASRSRPGWEMVEFATTGRNTDGDTVLSFESAAFAADLD